MSSHAVDLVVYAECLLLYLCAGIFDLYPSSFANKRQLMMRNYKATKEITLKHIDKQLNHVQMLKTLIVSIFLMQFGSVDV